MKLRLTSKAQKELDGLEDKIAFRISQKIYQLENDPFELNSQKLGGGKGYRIRIGDYRVVYTVDKTEKTITIIRIRHRRDVYR
jgi:mRNA interferase RelE/StbE